MKTPILLASEIEKNEIADPSELQPIVSQLSNELTQVCLKLKQELLKYA